MEHYNHPQQIQLRFSWRNLIHYLFLVDNVVRADAGIAEKIEKVVFPFSDKLGLTPEKLTLAVTT